DEDPQQGMAVSRERKLEIAERAAQYLTEKFGFPLEDVYFDPLVFPCATGDEQYIGSAAETIEGIRLIKQRFPMTKTILGVSNVSFGLPAASREVLNSVFLYHCVQAGLDLAIVNSEKLERFGSIPAEEIELAENLLFNRGEDPIGKFAANFRDRKAKAKKDRSTVPLEERLSLCVIEGSKDGLIEDLEEARKTKAPLDIINGPLMAGMDEVGKLFNANKLIVAEVLQSAEVMKAAVSHLEQFMEKTDSATRGKVLLATVKGDVHDIGKNLVDIILSNNGYKVINLGIKIPPEQLIQATREHQPDMIGLSGLLVKSAQQMVTTAEDLQRAGIATPILVGGAALSRNFTEKRILPAYGGTVLYAADAMNGLDLANKVMSPDAFATLQNAMEEKKRQARQTAPTEDSQTPAPSNDQSRSTAVPILTELPQPPDNKRHIERSTPLDLIWNFVNPLMLYTRHLGIRARIAKQFEKIGKDPSAERTIREEDPRALEIWEQVEAVKAEYRHSELLKASAVMRFFRARSEGNALLLFDGTETARPSAQFVFERQTKGERLCLSDYVSPNLSAHDNIAMFVVSVGKGLRYEAEKLKDSGQFLKSHILQALAIESAEAYAELMHSQIRMAWGFPDEPNMTMMDRFQARYRGKRYSFGYPACPRLEDQVLLFELLNPTEIGVNLTDGYMMDPEASVSAIVFHHPDAKYFGV
ncbi:MAG: B12-binding domain-containing protein, partial [Bdellovibrionaceae bacterium]|nr:B12-binding domain-containing protein [Pseudobdellovibrionaceae bacterium]